MGMTDGEDAGQQAGPTAGTGVKPRLWNSGFMPRSTRFDLIHGDCDWFDTDRFLDIWTFLYPLYTNY